MLPEGYILQSKKEREANRKEAEEHKNSGRTIEEDIEDERNALKSDNLTPVTKESFLAWKERRAAEKQKKAEEDFVQSQQSAEAKRKLAKGKNSVMSGRALFSYNPAMFKDDENAIEEMPEENVDESMFGQEEGKEEDEVDFD